MQKVLVYDTDLGFQIQVAREALGLGLLVVVAESPVDFIERLDGEDFALVVADCLDQALPPTDVIYYVSRRHPLPQLIFSCHDWTQVPDTLYQEMQFQANTCHIAMTAFVDKERAQPRDIRRALCDALLF